MTHSITAPARRRNRIRNSRGAFDLMSVLVGILVTGIIAGAIGVTVFSVLPWWQDELARADLAATRSAEANSKLEQGRYQNESEIRHNGGEIPDSVIIASDYRGACFVAFTRSATGKILYVTDRNDTVKEYERGDEFNCTDPEVIDATLESLPR